MNLLYLTHRVPYPPNRGDRIRSYHQLRFLADRSDISLAALTDEPVAAETRDHLDSLCRRVAIEPLGKMGRALRALSSVLRGRTVTEGAFHCPQLAHRIAAWAQEQPFDAVLIYCSSMLQYALLESLSSALRVIDLVDVDSEKWLAYRESASPPRRWLYGVEGHRLRQLECALPSLVQDIVLVSRAEAELLARVCPNANPVAITNGVDLDYFTPPAWEAQPAGTAAEDGPRCVFVGVLDYRANVDGLKWFCQDVWPPLLQRFPQATLHLVGRRPAAEVQQLAQRAGVRLVGEVADVRPSLQAADAVIAPLRIARGVQNKVLEGLAMSKAVVASPAALQGLSAVAGRDLLCAREPAEWIEQLATLFVDARRRVELGQSGRRYVEQHHSWDACLRPLAGLLGVPSEPCTA